MITDKPLVSIIVPAFNAEKFIARTLDSIIRQTHQNLEILVVDDGSTDRTADIVNEFIEKDTRIYLLQKTNSGVADARNLGIQHSQGDYIAPIDADDIWMPEFVEKQVKLILDSPATIGMTYAWSFDIDEDDKLTGGFHVSWWKGDVYLPFICRNFIGNASAALIRRSCFEAVGGYNSSLREQNAQGCEDLDLYLRIAAKYQVSLVPEFLVGYRQLRGSMSRNFHIMEKSHQLILKSVYEKNLYLYEKLKPWATRNFYTYLAHQSHNSGNFKESQKWLLKALNEDFLMTILGHELYVFSALNLFCFWFKGNRPSQLSPTTSSRPWLKVYFLRKRVLLDLAVLKEFLPAKLYERIRIKQLLEHNYQTLDLAVEKNNL